MKKKNTIMAIVQKEDPARYRSRTVEAEKGKGRKNRPRNKKVAEGDLPFNRLQKSLVRNNKKLTECVNKNHYGMAFKYYLIVGGVLRKINQHKRFINFTF
jgi:hypothetical protein